MCLQLNHTASQRPDPTEPLVNELRQSLDDAIRFCTAESAGLGFLAFERRLWPMLMAFGRLLIALFLASRHRDLDLGAWVACGRYRRRPDAPRTLRTRCGPVRYWRAYLASRKGKQPGVHPLDVELGLTRDGFSPWLIHFVTRLATRMSYAAARRVCVYALGWSPSTAAIEEMTLGLGRQAAPYMKAAPAPQGEGEVLVIEVDGKCTPTATAAELAKRRRKRRAKHDCGCGEGRSCQRHRGQQRRRDRGAKKRRKKGDHSKNGREITLVAMYTLRRGPDGKLHGPINKKVFGSYGGRAKAAKWARRQATKRGFGPGTDKKIEIIVDGAKGLWHRLKKQFPTAEFVVDVRHVQEKLWQAGRAFHKEGTAELASWVKELEDLLFKDKAEDVLERLKELQEQVPQSGPGTKTKRQALAKTIRYIEPRLEMMCYGKLQKQDLVIASGVVEGAARYVVGERMDCAGMRWTVGRAEALLQLRCIELNGDWEPFFDWAHARYVEQMHRGKAVRIMTDKPLNLAKAA